MKNSYELHVKCWHVLRMEGKSGKMCSCFVVDDKMKKNQMILSQCMHKFGVDSDQVWEKRHESQLILKESGGLCWWCNVCLTVDIVISRWKIEVFGSIWKTLYSVYPKGMFTYYDIHSFQAIILCSVVLRLPAFPRKEWVCDVRGATYWDSTLYFPSSTPSAKKWYNYHIFFSGVRAA